MICNLFQKFHKFFCSEKSLKNLRKHTLKNEEKFEKYKNIKQSESPKNQNLASSHSCCTRHVKRNLNISVTNERIFFKFFGNYSEMVFIT